MKFETSLPESVPLTITAIQSFETRVFGKWILAGEHSVLRGSPALVFPLYSCYLDFAFQNQGQEKELRLQLMGPHGDEMRLLFWGVLEKACEMCGLSRSDFRGVIQIRSTVPVGAGLGASASLCVALSRWFHSLGQVANNDLYEFARSLENLFHGESSGVDIAVALSGQGLRFVRDGERKSVALNWSPRWYVSYSGQRGITSECVAKVKALLLGNPELGNQIDLAMQKAVMMAEKALEISEVEGLPLLAEAIQLGAKCFEQWGLMPQDHVQKLREAGAIAVKPTGSGGGGYVLSLWDREPTGLITDQLIPCFVSNV